MCDIFIFIRFFTDSRIYIWFRECFLLCDWVEDFELKTRSWMHSDDERMTWIIFNEISIEISVSRDKTGRFFESTLVEVLHTLLRLFRRKFNPQRKQSKFSNSFEFKFTVKVPRKFTPKKSLNKKCTSLLNISIRGEFIVIAVIRKITLIYIKHSTTAKK